MSSLGGPTLEKIKILKQVQLSANEVQLITTEEHQLRTPIQKKLLEPGPVLLLQLLAQLAQSSMKKHDINFNEFFPLIC